MTTIDPNPNPLRQSFSQEELIVKARSWIRAQYPAGEYDQDLRMTRLGLLVDFVTDLVPNEKELHEKTER